MKRTLKLTFNEIKHLKWTVLVTALALTLFTASLFSVIFVYNDLSDNVFNYFDSTDEPLSFYAYNASVNMVTTDSQNGLFDGEVNSLMRNVVVSAANGNSFSTNNEIVDDNGVITSSTWIWSRAVCVTQRYLDENRQLFETIPLPQKANEIMLEKEYAEKLQVNIGDIVTISGRQFTVCGTYDREQYDWDYFDYAYGFVISVDENTVFDEVKVILAKSKHLYEAYLTLQKNGVEVELGSYAKSMVDNLSLVNGFLIAIAITIFVVNLLILYAMFSVILRNRRAYVCRLKVMGASDLLVFATYFAIIVVLLVIICVAAFFLSQVIVESVMDACGEAFESPFTTRVSFGLVGIYFAAIIVLLGALCYLSVRKIDNAAIVSATRSD